MDNKMAQRIRNFSTWEDLQQFEKNARDRKQLTEEMADAIKDRGADLGMLLIAEKTGLDVTDLSPAEKKIVRAVSEYVGVMKQLGKYPGRTLEQLRNRGLIDAAEIAVCRAKPTQGYQTLSDAGLEELSYERIVLEHQEEFSPRAVWFSRRTLGLPNETETAPTPTHSDIQTRTSTLLSWLKNEAANNEGVIPSYSNADAAEVMGIGDMRRYGQVHGNIQSRIDFACYLAGLPPLGLSADAPFSKAWSTENRDWQFPIADMQAVAQSRVWSAAEFDRILRATEGLPGQAHIFWKEELVSRVAKIKDWAYSYLGSASVERPPRKDVNGVRRNPPWARDELILALDLYLNYRAKPLAKDSAEIVELSGFLNKMGRAMGLVDMDTFRNPNGVYMKMMNFRRFDPEYTGDGKVGLTRGNKDEEVVWDQFANDPEHLRKVVVAIRAAIELSAYTGELNGLDEPEIQEAEEGRVLTRLHRVRERSRKLVEQCKNLALKKHGRLFCAACGFDFEVKYGIVGRGVIEVHHTKPVHTLSEGDKTKIDDLALLCANCHRVVHSSKKWLTVDQVKALVEKR